MGGSGMGVHVTAHLQQRGTDSREAIERASRQIEVDADSYDSGKRLILEQLPSGWLAAGRRGLPGLHTCESRSSPTQRQPSFAAQPLSSAGGSTLQITRCTKVRSEPSDQSVS